MVSISISWKTNPAMLKCPTVQWLLLMYCHVLIYHFKSNNIKFFSEPINWKDRCSSDSDITSFMLKLIQLHFAGFLTFAVNLSTTFSATIQGKLRFSKDIKNRHFFRRAIFYKKIQKESAWHEVQLCFDLLLYNVRNSLF